MTRKKLFPALPLAAASAIALVLAGCSSSDGTPAGETGDAQTGGTLKVLANGDADHIDPQLVAYVPSNSVVRAISRSILSYEASNDETERSELVGDLAAEVPEATDDGLTYTITLRDGVTWDAPDGARPIVSGDVERGIKRICNPYTSAALGGYFTGLIEGMAEFCDGFASVAPEAEPMKEYIENTDITGIETPDDQTVVFKLTEPASDFTSMLSLPTANPAPVEVLDYIPDSPEYKNNFVASGPYTVAEHTPDVKLTLERNESWDPESDPLRAAYVDSIEMTMGVEEDAAMQQLQAGSADMLFDLQPGPANIQQLTSVNDEKFSTLENGGVDQFMWINTKTSNNGGALQQPEVREALQYAIDKTAVVQVMGGDDIAEVTNGIFGPGINGYEEYAPYGDGSGKADPEKAKELLAQAGAENLTLKFPYRNLGTQPDIAQTVQASLEEVGITVELFPVPPTDYYANFMTNHENAVNGEWDIALVGWSPDWVGGAARSVFQPQFTFDGTPQSYNYVDYNNDEANALAAQALAASSPEEAGELWHQVDMAVMKDSPIVSIVAKKKANYHSDRVQDFEVYALSQNGDWTNVWLKN
ncbi:ABC transporter substrate-binding protein [Agromyces aerolatus]|uniref:ABC transporter substrate-binding protein n=1 Tax=Agromyces sp. LY-1074 TaxID=3074080 RepID=UPI00285693B9|nr:MULTISPECIES: ABC transporter substrate-binding protein [unclassified Agromyces]MDR5701555.1 ABC transporter substrate-binding protein [Agromyces sp. LY-1074]MDR5707838.1 ABC transporter substrate-binding protein [Agromyces sp. LY-1358]